jgi:hypothetical protein
MSIRQPVGYVRFCHYDWADFHQVLIGPTLIEVNGFHIQHLSLEHL